MNEPQRDPEALNPPDRPDPTPPPPAAPWTGDASTSSGGRRLPDLGPRGEGWVAIQFVLFALLAVAGSAGPAWGEPWLTLGRMVGAVHVVAGVVVAALGLVGLRENLTPVPRPIAGGRLVSHGVYGVVRHPVYAGIILAGVGWGLVTASPAALAVAAGIGVFFDLKSRREEAWLLEAYPAYAEYRRRVRKLLPFLY